MSEYTLIWSFALAVAGIAGAMGGYWAGKEETEIKYQHRWSLEVAAREMTQERHEWQKQYANRIKAAILILLLMAAPCWAVNVVDADGEPSFPVDKIINADPPPGTCLDSVTLEWLPCGERQEAERIEQRDKDIDKIQDVYQRMKTINEAQKGQP